MYGLADGGNQPAILFIFSPYIIGVYYYELFDYSSMSDESTLLALKVTSIPTPSV